jgi:RNA polymerase sigma factor (sigma-70 family)
MDGQLDDLVARARSGDMKAEEELFRVLRARFFAFAKRKVGDPEAAKDIAQDACVTVLQKYKTTTFTTSFAAWAHGVLKNKIGNYWQGGPPGGIKDGVDMTDGVTPTQPDGELRRKLIWCFRFLMKKNRRYARALNLVYQGYRTDEICRRLGVNAGNLYAILCRARASLKKCIEKGGV